MDRTVRATVVELLHDDPAFAAAYLEAALDESGEPDGREALLLAQRHIAEAKGMAQVACAAGVQRETLYRSLSPHGNSTLKTMMDVIKATGLRFHVGRT